MSPVSALPTDPSTCKVKQRKEERMKWKKIGGVRIREGEGEEESMKIHSQKEKRNIIKFLKKTHS